MQGATAICIFTGIMDAALYVNILMQHLLPFLQTKFFEDNHVNWWKTPPESPDLNPIENLWHELKEYLRSRVKPRTQHELVEGIKTFWSTVDRAKCTKYIRHLDKVIPRVIELKGDATGY